MGEIIPYRVPPLCWDHCYEILKYESVFAKSINNLEYLIRARIIAIKYVQKSIWLNNQEHQKASPVKICYVYDPVLGTLCKKQTEVNIATE